MPTQSEYNQFRRLVGDYVKNSITNIEIDAYLNDAVYELTSDFTTPVTDFDTLVVQYHPESVYKAAINWWWNTLASLQDKHSMSAGQAAQNVGEKWDRALQMVQQLEEKFLEIQTLGIDIDIGNLSHFSRSTLTRLGGQSEERALGGS